MKPSPQKHKGTSLCMCVVKASPRLSQDSMRVTLQLQQLYQSLPPWPPTAVTSQHFSPLKSQDEMGLMNSSHAGLIKYPFVCIIAVSNASLGRSGETGLTARLSEAAEKDPLYLFIRRRSYSQLACLCSRRPVCIFIHRINPGISHTHAAASPRTAHFDRRGARLQLRRRRWSEAACRSNY